MFESLGQSSNFRTRIISAKQDTIQLDTLSIYPPSFQLFCDGTLQSPSKYELLAAESKLVLKFPFKGVLKVSYRTFQLNLSRSFQKRDTSFMYDPIKGNRSLYVYTPQTKLEDVFGGTSLNKSGSISRGVTFGNNQDMGINSSLNLELNGQLGPNMKVLASVSDDNIPIQPDGNTNKLQEFDKVFIQVYNDRLKLIAGDFWIDKPTGYFMTYKKRAQGLNLAYDFRDEKQKGWKTQVSGAFSKGKFNRQIIQGVEGNQGPYRLIGAQNEPFIIILAGTERVYIDGKLLNRGQEFDYTIDYNTSELTFTSRNQITKDSRIVIEFQYSDQNYARSMFQTSNEYHSEKFQFWFNAYSEQDAKNQTIQQELSTSQKQHLASIGDTLSLARISSIDSVGFVNNQTLYRLIDTLGYDSVLVYSVDPNVAVYQATFLDVGSNKGNYIMKEYVASGKVFEWVAPTGGVPQGNYEPSILMVTPKKRQMITIGGNYQFSDYISLETELAYTNYDLNTFSKYDSRDDHGVGVNLQLKSDVPLKRKDTLENWSLKSNLKFETIGKYFNPIEKFRTVEFNRDWNTRFKGYEGNQIATNINANFVHKKYGNFNVEGQQYLIGKDFNAYRALMDGVWGQKGFNAKWEGSYMESKAVENSQYFRHRVDVSQSIKWLRFGYKDDHELNLFSSPTTKLASTSYQFFDYQFYLENSDSINNKYRVFYRERYDWRADSLNLQKAARAKTAGGEIKLTELKNQSLNILTSYRQLEILDSNLINQEPENSILGRIDYNLRLWKSAVTWNTFYEVGSGLERKKEFLYLEVNAGQGIYTWIDYDDDGVKDLNEFEIAQYVDQASYIRVFTPSNVYIKTYSNEFNQSLFLRPDKIWSSKKGFLKGLAKFSNKTSIRINRKTNYFDGWEAFNPFQTNVRDSNILATSYNFRNTFYFNRTSPIVSANWVYQKNQNKTLLASGFDSRKDEYHELNARWNITPKIAIEASGKMGNKTTVADYTTGRNYSIDYKQIKPSLTLQTSTSFRVSLVGRYEEKHNAENFGGESAYIGEVGTNLKFNQAKKGSLQCEFKMISIKYNGIQSSSLGFEMLESLKPGINYTWNFGYQRLISKNLQLSIQYNGRKSEGNKFIHSAGMEVRAFF